MKILLIAYQFPPYHNVGSLRIGKFAKHLDSNGHEITVLCAEKILMPSTLEVEINENRIIRTKWINVNALPQFLFGGRDNVIKEGYKTKSGLLKKFGYIYRLFTNFPDDRIGWFPFAIQAGNKIIAKRKFDYIYASSPSPTSLLVANRLSRKWKIPWIAEFRDPWADKAHYDFPEWRRKIEKSIERKILKNVSGIVTISDPLAEEFRSKYNKPTITSMNGFSQEDIIKNKRHSDLSKNLEIIYTGTVHLDIVHLGPLFDAISILGDDGQKVKLNFYTRYIDGILDISRPYKLQNQVVHYERVPYKLSLEIQRNADVLLFLIPHQHGALSTKIFEYISSLRPILAIGDIKSTAGKFISDLEMGLVSGDPEEISIQIKTWLEIKNNFDGIPDYPECKRIGFSRNEQFEKIEEFLNKLSVESKK